MSSNKDGDNILDFTELEKAFQNQPQEFIKTLKMVLEDFIGSQMLMLDAVNEKSLGNFRMIHHNLRANIILFKIKPFAQLMDKIESLLSMAAEQSIPKVIVEELHEHFNLIFQNLENKIKELSQY